ncbi:MAG: hypothetical protein HDQ97_13035 [Lachnospiraceae bacterium]|nr:hypothetical protein [Lachnospiraceae bacterium]
MLKFFSLICAIITFFMSILHIFLLIGMPIGEYVLGGQNKVIPLNKRWINLVFVFLFLGLFYLGKSISIPFQFSEVPSKIIMIVYSLFLAYAIIGNIFFTKSKKEKVMMIPASIIVFACSFATLLLSW